MLAIHQTTSAQVITSPFISRYMNIFSYICRAAAWKLNTQFTLDDITYGDIHPLSLLHLSCQYSFMYTIELTQGNSYVSTYTLNGLG